MTFRHGSRKTTLEMADGLIAVSQSTAADVARLFDCDPATITVIPNGIDTETYAPHPDPACLTTYGIDAARPYVLFVGRMTQQKGLRHLLDAVPYLSPDAQVVLCAGPPIPRHGARVRGGSGAFATATDRGDLIPTMVPRQTTIALTPRRGLLLPIYLRALRTHQSGSHGL